MIQFFVSTALCTTLSSYRSLNFSRREPREPLTPTTEFSLSGSATINAASATQNKVYCFFLWYKYTLKCIPGWKLTQSLEHSKNRKFNQIQQHQRDAVLQILLPYPITHSACAAEANEIYCSRRS